MRFKRPLHSLLLLSSIASSSAFVVLPKTSITTTSRLFAAIDKNVYQPSKIIDQDYDAIVIGSGIGGLTTASLMAQAGKKVLVLEQHYVAGGACHTFTRRGYEFATGIHYVGEVDEKYKKKRFDVNLREIVDAVTSKDDPIVWDRMDDTYETVYIGPSKYEIVAGEEALKKKMIQSFPDEQDAIEEYYKLVKRVRASAMKSSLLKALPLSITNFLTRTGLYRLVNRGYRKWTTTTVQQRLSNLTKNKDLQALLAYNYADYGTDPGRAPFYMQALLATHYLEGAYYPRGGPSNIAKKIIHCITQHGGQVLVSAPVERILLADESDAVTGVELKDGNVICSDVVISDAGLINTAKKLCSPGLMDVDFAADNSPTLLHPGTTGINLFVGLEGNATSLNLPKSNVWIHSRNDLAATADRIHSLSLEQALLSQDLGVLFVGCPPTKDSSWSARHANKSTLEIITLAPYHWFEKFQDVDTKKSHGPEYEAAKQKLAEKMWERTVQVLDAAKLPKTLRDVPHYEVGTPLTFGYYYNSQRGSWYGLDHDLHRFAPSVFFGRLRPEVPEISGLYLTGQDVMVDGMIGAMFGGLLCARKVLGVVNPKSLLRKKKTDEKSRTSGRRRGQRRWTSLTF